jgi:protease-4
MIEALREARTRSSIKAVVLRIDSPGGSVQASDDIWREVKRLSEDKPVIVSMSDLAASGGYYIAVPAQRIVAQPATLTGSIGVFGGKLNIGGLFRKLGVNIETLSRGPHANMMSPYRDFTAEERQMYQQQIDGTYRMFLSRVVEGRGLTYEEADSIGQGRVWSGLDAWQIGLVDTLGGLETAMSLACDAAGIAHHDRAVVETLPKVDHHWYESLFEDLLDSGGDSSFGRLTATLGLGRATESAALEHVTARALLSPVVRAWLTASRLQSGMSFALMPYSIEIR